VCVEEMCGELESGSSKEEGKKVVVIMIKPSPKQCRVLQKHLMRFRPWERSCMLTTSPK
jgi:hypothetical protein